MAFVWCTIFCFFAAFLSWRDRPPFFFLRDISRQVKRIFLFSVCLQWAGRGEKKTKMDQYQRANSFYIRPVVGVTDTGVILIRLTDCKITAVSIVCFCFSFFLFLTWFCSCWLFDLVTGLSTMYWLLLTDFCTGWRTANIEERRSRDCVWIPECRPVDWNGKTTAPFDWRPPSPGNVHLLPARQRQRTVWVPGTACRWTQRAGQSTFSPEGCRTIATVRWVIERREPRQITLEAYACVQQNTLACQSC